MKWNVLPLRSHSPFLSYPINLPLQSTCNNGYRCHIHPHCSWCTWKMQFHPTNLCQHPPGLSMLFSDSHRTTDHPHSRSPRCLCNPWKSKNNMPPQLFRSRSAPARMSHPQRRQIPLSFLLCYKPGRRCCHWYVHRKPPDPPASAAYRHNCAHTPPVS